MIHEFKQFTYVHEQGKSKLYKGNHLIFKGNSWSGILMFLQQTDNAPEVRQMFKAQLEQREQVKNKQEKQTPTPPVIEEPIKEKVIKRPSRKTKEKSLWD